MAARLAPLLAAALVALPPLMPKYALEVLISILFFGYLGACWNILGGYGGQFSFGHAAFFVVVLLLRPEGLFGTRRGR